MKFTIGPTDYPDNRIELSMEAELFCENHQLRLIFRRLREMGSDSSLIETNDHEHLTIRFPRTEKVDTVTLCPAEF